MLLDEVNGSARQVGSNSVKSKWCGNPCSIIYIRTRVIHELQKPKRNPSFRGSQRFAFDGCLSSEKATSDALALAKELLRCLL